MLDMDVMSRRVRLPIVPALVCRRETFLRLDDKFATRNIASGASDVSLPLLRAGGVAVQGVETAQPAQGFRGRPVYCRGCRRGELKEGLSTLKVAKHGVTLWLQILVALAYLVII